jgi:hypothetical protein
MSKLTVMEIAEHVKLNPQTVGNWIFSPEIVGFGCVDWIRGRCVDVPSKHLLRLVAQRRGTKETNELGCQPRRSTSWRGVTMSMSSLLASIASRSRSPVTIASALRDLASATM